MTTVRRAIPTVQREFPAVRRKVLENRIWMPTMLTAAQTTGKREAEAPTGAGVTLRR